MQPGLRSEAILLQLATPPTGKIKSWTNASEILQWDSSTSCNLGKPDFKEDEMDEAECKAKCVSFGQPGCCWYSSGTCQFKAGVMIHDSKPSGITSGFVTQDNPKPIPFQSFRSQPRHAAPCIVRLHRWCQRTRVHFLALIFQDRLGQPLLEEYGLQVAMHRREEPARQVQGLPLDRRSHGLRLSLPSIREPVERIFCLHRTMHADGERREVMPI